MKKLLLVALVIIIITSSLTGCTRLKEMYDKYQAFMQPYYEESYIARERAEQFLFAIANDDFETAREFLHPDLIASEYDLEGFVELFEEVYDTDFSSGVVIEKQLEGEMSIGCYNRHYSNAVEYKSGVEFSIEGKKFELYFLTVRTDNGFGIYELTDYPKGYHN